MNLLFLSLGIVIAVTVILVTQKFIKAGFVARSKVKDQEKNDKKNQEILDKLKDKNLSEADLKNLYEEIKNKDKEDK
tara:strand:- start:421 stop:651 length:231 start_codon:yes stop_codon:yes gene_type:complete